MDISKIIDFLEKPLNNRADTQKSESEFPSDGDESIRSDGSRCEHTFSPGLVLKIFCIHWFVALGIFGAGVYFMRSQPTCQRYSLLIYLQAGYWLFTDVLLKSIKSDCRKLFDRDRQLYDMLKSYRSKPLAIVTGFKSILLGMQGITSENFMKVDCDSLGEST
ncbi:uncharacterized protein LOC129759613 [Uranotaenia lowii]|uniref:uncharacterized protein LOC129759613 n=1 Tax=Uranotaenia lowii TaxID=190385 RepID=UPI002479BA08|nr:uncharacterized protein LOC129759613 [Uranotaenia lowii]